MPHRSDKGIDCSSCCLQSNSLSFLQACCAAQKNWFLPPAPTYAEIWVRLRFLQGRLQAEYAAVQRRAQELMQTMDIPGALTPCRLVQKLPCMSLHDDFQPHVAHMQQPSHEGPSLNHNSCKTLFI